MTSEFEQDLKRCRSELDSARQELLGVVTSLGESDLDRGRRGSWSVRRVLEHVIWSEWMYARVITHLRGGQPPGDAVDATPSSAVDAAGKLAASHAALIAEVEGVDEDTFYAIGRLGQEEYSVLSVLENEINHEREHAEQVRTLVSSADR